MTWSIVVPWTAGDATRLQARHYVREHYQSVAPMVMGCCEPGLPWSKGVALDDGVARTDSDGLILLDADCVVSLDELHRSMTVVEAGAPWSMPHDTVARLSRRATGKIYAGTLPHSPPSAISLERPTHHAPRGGGIVILSRGAYDDVGGIDDRFVGWGGEDISFGRALDTIVGPCVQFDATLLHLWHRPQPIRPGRRGSPANEALASRYLDAVGNRAAMVEVSRT